MADIDIEAIETRVNAATPGPWQRYVKHENLMVATPGKKGVVIVDLASDRDESVDDTECERNAEFIAAARTDVPALVAEVRRLEDLLVNEVDVNRCEACRRVFNSDEGEYGEDCWLCKGCAAAARTEFMVKP